MYISSYQQSTVCVIRQMYTPRSGLPIGFPFLCDLRTQEKTLPRVSKNFKKANKPPNVKIFLRPPNSLPRCEIFFFPPLWAQVSLFSTAVHPLLYLLGKYKPHKYAWMKTFMFPNMLFRVTNIHLPTVWLLRFDKECKNSTLWPLPLSDENINVWPSHPPFQSFFINKRSFPPRP